LDGFGFSSDIRATFAQDADLANAKKIPTERALVISIHDVSPLTWRQTNRILEDLRGLLDTKTSLLIIPDHHRRGRISADAEFLGWLKARVAGGHEAVLHGFFHLRGQKPGEGLAKKLVTQSYTAGEGEFFDLEREEAALLLREGQAELAAADIAPTGFIAPAWLLGSEAEVAVRQAGFGYTTRIATVVDYKNAQTHRSRSLVWSVRARWRRVCSLAWNRALFFATKSSLLLRIGIHPPDWDHRAIRRQILALTRAALADREAMTYQQWLLQQRSLR
jgi:predicted deacetylase